MNKILFMSSMYLLCFMSFVSCTDKNSPDNNNTDTELKSGGTMKITASSGTIQTVNYVTTLQLTGFRSDITYSTDNSIISTSLYITTDFGIADLFFDLPNPIKINNLYSFTYKVDNYFGSSKTGIELEDWIATDGLSSGNVAKTTISISRFQYPGRITGVAINYDKAGKTLVKGEFDFVSVKPQI